MNTFKRLYKQKYNPVILRDVLSDCDIAQHEIAQVVGLNKETLRFMATRGYIPSYKKDAVAKVESFISGNTKTRQWLREKGLNVKNIWGRSNRRVFHLYPSGYADRLYHSRREGTTAAYRKLPKTFLLIQKQQKERSKKLMQSKLEVLSEFGYSKDPFKSFYMETADSLRIKRLLKMAIESRAMVSIVASWGFGKTSSLDLAFQDIDAKVVRLVTPDKERVVVSDIEKALILGLSNEPCKRTKEIRARQIRRITGEMSKEKPVVLILEEAHRMHGSTLRALKTFREMEWMGQSPLFTVVMIGQYDPMRKRYVDEVRLRTDTVFMKGLTSSEIKAYIKGTVGKYFADDAAEAIADLDSARNFLDLQEILINLMAKALQNGTRKVTSLEVFELYAGGLKEVMKRAGISLVEIEKETGIPKSTLSLVANDKPNTMTPEKNAEVKQAITDVLKKILGADDEKHHKGLRVI